MQFFGRPKRSKQGVGSIIGAVFVILILLSGLTFYATYLSITDDYYGTVGSMGDLGWSQNQEKIAIKQVTLTAANSLNLTVENQGAVQSRLIWIGLFNKSAVPADHTYYPLDEHLNPSEKLNIVTNFTVVLGLKYTIQLVTALGNTIQNVFYPASEVQCALSLTIASPTAYEGNNVTVMLTVTHNDTDVDTIQSLTASVNMSPGGLVQLVDNSPLTVNGLTRGGSAFFWWIYSTISIGTVTFNASYSQAPAGTYALTNVNVLASPGQGGGGSVSISGVNGTAEYNPSQWTLLGSTQYDSGLVADLTSNDSSYAVFRSYYTGTSTDINHSVDNNSSNVDGSTNLGTHSNFTALQYGPDSQLDTLTEGNTNADVGTSGVFADNFDASWSNWSGNGATTWINGTDQYQSSPNSAKCGSTNDGYLTSNDINMTGASQIGVTFWIRDHLLDNADGYLYYYDGSVYDQIVDLNSITTSEDTWIRYSAIITDSQYFKSNFRIRFYETPDNNEICWIEDVVINKTIPNNYKLDMEVQWTNADYDETYEYLYIYTGALDSENLKVDVWTGSWTTVINALQPNQLNTVNVSSYLTSSNFTIRFNGGSETGDTNQDSWNLDVALLHVWSDEYTSEVEFTRSSDLQAWTSLLWQIQSCWNISQVTVTIRFYNFTLDDYVSSGTGYVSYVSNAIPNTNELWSQTELSSPNDFKNSTGHWRVKIKGVKAKSTQFLMKVDWIDLQIAYSTTGDTIPHSTWQLYSLKATTASGDSIPYAYVSIYANGTLVYFRNATEVDIGNPAWVRLDAGGQFMLEVKSASGSAEAFVLYAVVGSIVGQKTVTQEAP